MGPGFEWIDMSDSSNSVLAYLRKGNDSSNDLLVVCNFSPQALPAYRVGLPEMINWQETLNTDDADYGGSGVKNSEVLNAEEIPCHGREYSLELAIPPLGVSILKRSPK